MLPFLLAVHGLSFCVYNVLIVTKLWAVQRDHTVPCSQLKLLWPPTTPPPPPMQIPELPSSVSLKSTWGLGPLAILRLEALCPNALKWKTRRALGGAHVPPTKLFPRLAVNKTILKPRITCDFPDVIKFRVAAHTISEKAIWFRHTDYYPDRAQKLISSSHVLLYVDTQHFIQIHARVFE